MVRVRTRSEETLDNELGPEPTIWPPKERLPPPHLRPHEPARQPQTLPGAHSDAQVDEGLSEWAADDEHGPAKEKEGLRARLKFAAIAAGAALAWMYVMSRR